MTTVRTALMTLAAFGFAAQLGAAEAPKVRSGELRTAREKLAWDAQATKGTPRQLLLLEQQKLDSLIDDLERGRPVDPAEIDRVLERAEHGAR